MRASQNKLIDRTLLEGDVLVIDEDNEIVSNVLGVCGSIVFVSHYNAMTYSNTTTMQELIREGIQVKE